MAKKGSLSINSENIFPVIKKWLYSDHDIFVRELISNGCDAVTKLKKLDMMGEYSYPDGFENKIRVIASPEKKTLKFIDTGLGMDADEVEEYITQIAFSGATDFLEKYKDKTNDDQIIGHFGLGFYSASSIFHVSPFGPLPYDGGSIIIASYLLPRLISLSTNLTQSSTSHLIGASFSPELIAFSFAQVTIPLEASTCVTAAPAFAAARVAPPV